MARCKYKHLRLGDQGYSVAGCQFSKIPEAKPDQNSEFCLLHGEELEPDIFSQIFNSVLDSYLKNLSSSQPTIDLSGIKVPIPLNVDYFITLVKPLCDPETATPTLRIVFCGSKLRKNIYMDSGENTSAKPLNISLDFDGTEAHSIYLNTQAKVSFTLKNKSKLLNDITVKSASLDLMVNDCSISGNFYIQGPSAQDKKMELAIQTEELSIDKTLLIKNCRIVSKIGFSSASIISLKSNSCLIHNCSIETDFSLIDFQVREILELDSLQSDKSSTMSITHPQNSSSQINKTIHAIDILNCSNVSFDLSYCNILMGLDVKNTIFAKPPLFMGAKLSRLHIDEKTELYDISDLENENIIRECVDNLTTIQEIVQNGGNSTQSRRLKIEAIKLDQYFEKLKINNATEGSKRIEAFFTYQYLWAYEKFSDYGRNYMLPIAFLTMWILLFISIFTLIGVSLDTNIHSFGEPSEIDKLFKSCPKGTLAGECVVPHNNVGRGEFFANNFFGGLRLALYNLFQPFNIINPTNTSLLHPFTTLMSILQTLGNLLLIFLSGWSLKNRFQS